MRQRVAVLTCKLIPSVEQSKFAWRTRSLMESRSFLSVVLCASFASNMVSVVQTKTGYENEEVTRERLLREQKERNCLK